MTRMDLDEWTTPNRRPDGSRHKFDVAYKDHPRGLHRAPGPRIALLARDIKIRPIRH
ncbi:MAG: hypothetical protein U0790_16065 [Isosphaeraceae bacterium]